MWPGMTSTNIYCQTEEPSASKIKLLSYCCYHDVRRMYAYIHTHLNFAIKKAHQDTWAFRVQMRPEKWEAKV